MPAIAKDTLSLPQNPTESFKGVYNEKEVVFTHSDYTTYTLSMGGVLTSGNLNTEKGYGDDRNATVYVLNPDKSKNEQMCFVRTPSGSVYMLDQDRFVLDDATFETAKAPGVKPPVTEKKEEKKAEPKPEVAKQVEKKAEAKPAAEKKTKKKSGSKTGKSKTKAKAASKDLEQKAVAEKKAPAKKATKTSKKKKKKKAARKKSSKKKKSNATPAPAAEKQDAPKADK